MTDLVKGVLKRVKKNVAFLRDPERSFRPGAGEVFVPPGIVRRFDLPEGALVEGEVKQTRKKPELTSVRTICGLEPEAFKERSLLRDLVALDPEERFHIADSGNTTMRILDMLSPVGKGTRGLIVSPPKAGKTMILEQLAHAIHHDDPDALILILLVDERPEEVTQFRRAVPGEVLASSNDQSVKEHVELVELTLAWIRTELECGRNVVVLLDSLTRMGRAFNIKGSGVRRTMSGGMEVGAMEIPRKFFGFARNVEHGGSITILATILVDTGSRMDQVIYEEFKGTGNMEVVLSRDLANRRIFPAINVTETGTRKEEKLIDPGDLGGVQALRKVLSRVGNRDAMEMLIEKIEETGSNREFLDLFKMEV